ncbi:MAG: tetratricopeptide repeat protein [Candidatus Xenobia bacterium]
MAQKAQRDYYRILDAPPACNNAELQRSYRDALARNKPEKSADRTNAERRTREIMDAFNCLKDEERRLQYDGQPHLQPRLVRKAPILKERDTGGKGFLGRFLGRKPEPVDFKQTAEKHFDKGVTLAHNNNFAGARDEFKVAVANDQTHLEAVYNLALMEYKLGRWRDAIVAFKQVLELDPTDFYSKVMIEGLQGDGI